MNPIFDDGYGNLNPESTGDDVHLYANYYADWVNWFKTVGVVTDEEADALAAIEAAKQAQAQEDANETEDSEDGETTS